MSEQSNRSGCKSDIILVLDRFLSPNTVVPGADIGRLDGMALKALTVNFNETALLQRLNAENNGGDAKLYRGGPLNPQALNRYSYVLNNPVNNTDPTGHAQADESSRAARTRQPSKSNPYRGTPGSTSTTHLPDGSPKQVRTYAPDGYPDVDTDYDHDHGQGVPHEHKWNRPPDGSPPEDADRGLGQPPGTYTNPIASTNSSPMDAPQGSLSDMLPSIPTPSMQGSINSSTQTAIVTGSTIVIIVIIIVLAPVGI